MDGDIMLSDARASTTDFDRGKHGRIFLSQWSTVGGISHVGEVGATLDSPDSNEGRASRCTRARKMASITVVVRWHFLSRPLRRMVASSGESMRQVKCEPRILGPAFQSAHSKPTVCRKSWGKARMEGDLAKTCVVR